MTPGRTGGGSPTSRLRGAGWRLGVLAVCLIGGLLLGTARSFSQGEDISNRSVDLSAVVRDAEQRVLNSDAQAAALQAQIDAAAAGDVSPQVEAARAGVAQLQVSAGLTPVEGPGIQVTMTDAPRDVDGNYPAGVDPDDLVVHQQDVQAVVNALWAGGAEAMMIMGQRVLTTSAVRCIGNTLLLQGRAYSPPFVVTAIGDAAAMSAALDVEPGVRLLLKYVDKFQLGYQVTTLDSVELPAYSAPIRLVSAQQAGR